MPTIRFFTDFRELPAGYADLLAVGRGAGLFFDGDWFAHLMQYAFHANDRFRLYGVEDEQDGRSLLLAPLRTSTADSAVAGARVVGSISHPENYAEAALCFAPAVTDRRRVLAALFAHLKAGGEEDWGKPCDVIRLWPLEEGSDLAGVVRGGLEDAGFWVQSYANSYNRYETTRGVAYADYFAARSANLRYSVRRRQRALAREHGLELALYDDLPGLESAMADYFAVSLASWKSPPTMIGKDTLELMRLAAAKGALRLGILRADGKPAAAQFWIVSGGVAHCARLAYDESFRALAAGVVLTNFMIAHVLDRDRVERIDFGYGPEDYKGGWMKEARNYLGYMAFNPATPAGRLQALRHIVGRPFKRGARQVLERLGLRLPAAEGAARGRAAALEESQR